MTAILGLWTVDQLELPGPDGPRCDQCLSPSCWQGSPSWSSCLDSPGLRAGEHPLSLLAQFSWVWSASRSGRSVIAMTTNDPISPFGLLMTAPISCGSLACW